MPVCLFTFHAHGSWMPDHTRGYVQRKKGVLPPDPAMAENYRRRARTSDVRFDDETRPLLIALVREACEHQQLRLHGVATDPTHLHLVVSWKETTQAKSVRANLKQSLTRRLNERVGSRVWFSRGGHSRKVEDAEHLQHLLETYLPGHVGPNWIAGKEEGDGAG